MPDLRPGSVRDKLGAAIAAQGKVQQAAKDAAAELGESGPPAAPIEQPAPAGTAEPQDQDEVTR